MLRAPLWPRLDGWCQRHAARVFYKRELTLTKSPTVSFTFDDFPRSALHTGGAILERAEARGTFYASFGLMGKTAPTGSIFVPDDIIALLERGHELGCHTFDHCHSWNTRPPDFERSVVDNHEILQQLSPGQSFRSFSYPLSPPRPRTKQRLSTRFHCARGGGQTFNQGTVDLNYLSAYFLEKAAGNRDAITRVIDDNCAAGGWLIFATHDVSATPTPYGCSPGFFEHAVESAVRSGARVMPVADALAAYVKAARQS
jgi:peptidoglycan/xylan/chitin deacetylase (PgdA/CDA1 family)